MRRKKPAAILTAAEQTAGKTLRQAETEAAEKDPCRQKKMDTGTARGKREQEMQARLGEQIEAFQNMIAEAARARDSMIDALEEEIITLVLETAKKVINIELEKNDNAFIELMRNALCQMKREGKIVIRVGPEDYAKLFHSGSAEFVIDSERIRATVMEEPLFERGDCIIDSEGETGQCRRTLAA